MSAKPKKLNRSYLSRPFDPKILAEARRIAEQYQVVIRFEDGEYYGEGLDLPGAMDDGKTPDECVAKTREAMVSLVAYMLEKGETPPPPAAEGSRTEQVNVRLTHREKLMMERQARAKGFRGISDYLRSLVVAQTI